MIEFQPFYIGGLEDPEEAKKNAFGAAFIFIITFFLSAYGMWHDSRHKKEEIDESNPENYQLSAGGAPAEYGSRYD
eukprot:CAMPEP_0197466172 /NCGR_PEP_ID=MMETSP1175-20131217/64915_1 /TAXON_ID=1003142 /ORGANISM="Triceratium dubium, Strain CCMP147" /LENGTH=75 /DNA_ID=CAMNT_0043002203 /DNA_START=215 /DNA_END=442 /DNA_ORIENTATION=+